VSLDLSNLFQLSDGQENVKTRECAMQLKTLLK